jgi:hypothetical protein
MSTQCSVCRRHDRHAIDAALAAGEPRRAIERRFGVPHATFTRHAQHAHEEEDRMPEALDEQPMIQVSGAQWELVHGTIERLTTELGKQRAVVASVERRCAELEARIATLSAHVERHERTIEDVQDLQTLLRSDPDAGATALQLVRSASVTSRPKLLLRWVARWIGRPLAPNDELLY